MHSKMHSLGNSPALGIGAKDIRGFPLGIGVNDDLGYPKGIALEYWCIYKG